MWSVTLSGQASLSPRHVSPSVQAVFPSSGWNAERDGMLSNVIKYLNKSVVEYFNGDFLPVMGDLLLPQLNSRRTLGLFHNADAQGCNPTAHMKTNGRRAQRKKNSGLLLTSTRDW